MTDHVLGTYGTVIEVDDATADMLVAKYYAALGACGADELEEIECVLDGGSLVQLRADREQRRAQAQT